ncbi:MAG TPA: class I SAM-dependent methyltransferase [Urbifossiella sp.]|nr:class I SAM-dependent methyltransferase [Urbifossiella sp.]
MRPADDSRRRGLLRLRHLREQTEAKAEDMEAQAGRFARLADPAAAPRVVSAFNLFQTPEPLAARLAGMFPAFGRVLEPSAGLGRLYRAVRALDAACPVVLVDTSAQCFRELYHATEGDPNAELHAADFLSLTPERLGLFDSIVMNPPFKNGTDVKHVTHARRFLAPGGRLVSLVAAGPRQQAALMAAADSWEDLPAGSFKAEGTNVAAAVVTFTHRPEPT